MPDAPSTSPGALLDILTALRAVLAEERRAIACLSLDALDDLAVRKRELSDALASCRNAGPPPDRDTARLLEVTRVDLGANAALIAAARDAIQHALGIPCGDSYGRSARLNVPSSTGSVWIVAR